MERKITATTSQHQQSHMCVRKTVHHQSQFHDIFLPEHSISEPKWFFTEHTFRWLNPPWKSHESFCSRTPRCYLYLTIEMYALCFRKRYSFFLIFIFDFVICHGFLFRNERSKHHTRKKYSTLSNKMPYSVPCNPCLLAKSVASWMLAKPHRHHIIALVWMQCYDIISWKIWCWFGVKC